MKSGKFAGETMRQAFKKGGSADKVQKAKTDSKEAPNKSKPTVTERNAVEDYSTDKFQKINGALRGESPIDGESQTIVKRIDSYLAKSPKREGASVRSFVIPEGREDEFKKMLSVGSTYSDEAYLSTRKKPSLSDQAAFSSKSTAERGVVLKVNGKSGVDISGTSLNPGESEVLYPRGTKFKVDKVIYTKNGGILAEISEVDS